MRIKLQKAKGVQVQIVKIPKVKGENGGNKSFTIYDTSVEETHKLIISAIEAYISKTKQP